MVDSRIHATAQLGEGCVLGHNVIIGERVQIGAHGYIGHHVVIHADTIVGERANIGDHVVLGKQPQAAATSTLDLSDALPGLRIGANCRIGTNAILYAGLTIGDNCMVADQAFVRENVTVGDYVIIGRSATVEHHTTIGDYTKIQSNAYITAYMTIEDHVFVAPCVVTSNDNFMGRTEERFKYRRGATIGHGARIGANATLLPGITIGRESFVAAGAVVTRDVPDAKLVMGVPARVIRDVPEKEFVENQ